MSDITNSTERVDAAPASDSQIANARGEGKESKETQFDKTGLLADLKRERSKRQEYEQRLQELERAKLEAEGKKDELISNYKQQLDEYKKKVVQSVRSKVEDQVAMKAQEFGCLDTEILLKTVDLDSIEVDSQTLRISNTEAVSAMLEEVKKKRPYLFKQQGAQVRDGVPTSKPNTKTDFKSMTKEQLIEFARKNGIT